MGKAAAIVLVLWLSLFLAGCQADHEAGSDAGRACVARVEFNGHVYSDQGSSHTASVKKGRRLGTGHPLGCSASDAGELPSTVEVFTAVGCEPERAVLVEAPYGVLQIDPADGR